MRFLIKITALLIVFTPIFVAYLLLDRQPSVHFHEPVPGVRTGGQPSRGDLSDLKAEGVTAVISLRTAEETVGYDEAAAAADLDMAYVSIPMWAPEELTLEAALKLDEIVGAVDGDVLLHCAAGNRAGALLALRAYHTGGASPDEALKLGRAAGLDHWADVVKTHMETTPPYTAPASSVSGQ